MKYLVTGGAGFIGSNLARQILKNGDDVRILDNFSTGRRSNLSNIKSDIEVIDGDIRDFATVEKAVAGIDYVLHQAALPSVPRSIEDPLTSNAVNIDGTLNVLEASRRAGVKKFVMASSSSVYGESEELPKHEKMIPSPLSPYAVTKLACEYYCQNYWNLYQFPTACLRYFNIFGPYQDPASQYAAVIPNFITALLEGKQPTVYGDGEQSRDFTFINDCVAANLLAISNDDVVGAAYNVACAGQFTLNDLLERLRNIIGVDIEAKYDPPRQGDIKHSYADVGKLEKHGYKPAISFEDGLARTVDFFRALDNSGKVKTGHKVG